MKFFELYTKYKVHLLSISTFLILDLIIFRQIFLGKVNLNGHLLVTFYTIFQKLLPFKDTGWDQIRWFFPNLSFTLSQLKSFDLPFWNPYIFAGHPHLANFQTAVFYPLNIFGFFLNEIVFWHFFRMGPHFLGAFFTYIYLKNLKLKTVAALFGSLTFGFSPLMLTWGEEIVILSHSIMWIPLILFFLDKYLDTNNPKFLGLFTIFLSTSIFAGFLQASIYSILLITLYLLFKAGPRRIFKTKLGLNFIFCLIFSLTICSVQLLPSFELYLNSTRKVVSWDILSDSLSPAYYLIALLAPDFFGNPATRNLIQAGSASYYEYILFIGVAALIFAIYAIASQLRNKMIRFYFGAALIATLLSLDFYFSRLVVILPIPFLSTAIPNRIIFLSAFSLSILAALGLDVYLRSKSKDYRLVKIIGFLAAIYIILIIFLLTTIYFKSLYFAQETKNAFISLRNLVMPILIFVTSSTLIIFGNFKNHLKGISVILVIFISVIHIIFFAHKYFTFVEREFIYPENEILDYLRENQQFSRSLSLSGDKLLNNILSKYQIYYPEGYDPATNKRYADFVSLIKSSQVSPKSRTVVELGAIDDVDKFFSSDANRKLANLLGIKYFFAEKSKSQILKEFSLKKVFEDSNPNGFAVFEDPRVLPRAFLVSYFEIIDSGQDSKSIPNKLLADDFNLRETIILDNPNGEITTKEGEGLTEIISYTPNQVTIKTESGVPKLLFLSDNYYPGWKAKIDNQETQVLRADYTFRAVAVPQGTHEVKFFFDSLTFKIGLYISLASIFLVVFIYFLPRRSLKDQ